MQADFQVTLTIILGTLLFFFLAGLIVVSALLYRRAQNQHQDEMVSVEAKYEEEILKTQLEIQEKTLEHVSQEIHDNIGQSLSLAKIHLTKLQGTASEEQKTRMDESRELVARSIQDLRSLSHSLNPTYLSNKKLTELVELEVEKLRKTNMDVEYQISGNQFFTDPEKRLFVYRMIQEISQNILKHAQATRVTVALTYKRKELVLVITDNGIGFDAEKARSKGSGFNNLYQRTSVIDAQLDVVSGDAGTSITITIKE
jgi:signal transduction histidine kinase